MKISDKIAGISPSVTLEINAKAKALKAEGKPMIAFTAGEPDFNTPDYIIDSAKVALDKGYTKYTPTPGIPELKSAIADKFLRDNGLSYKPSQIVVSSGAKSSLFHAIYALVNPGDEVIVPAPYWITYTEQIALCGAKAVIVKTDQKSGYKLLKSDFEKAITPKTACVLINTPCNPTGVVYSKKELLDIAEVAEKHNIAIISDEIYENLIFNGQKHISIASLTEYAKNNTVVINGVSKTYSMTGWRIGYLGAPENVAKAIGSMQGHTTSNACSIAQYAALRALNGDNDFVDEMREVFCKRRNLIVGCLNNAGFDDFIQPDGAFYVFVNISKYLGKTILGKQIIGSVSFADALLDFGVAVIPGLAFGADDFIRLAYTVSEDDIKNGIAKMKEFVDKLS